MPWSNKESEPWGVSFWGGGTRRQGVQRGVSKAGAGHAVNDITKIMMIVLCKH